MSRGVRGKKDKEMKKIFMLPVIFFTISCVTFVPREVRVERKVTGINLQKGVQNLKEKNYESALSFFYKAKNTGEDPHLSQFYITYTHYLLKDYDNTIREGNKFLRNFPGSELKDEVFYFMGVSFEKQRFYVRAAESFIRAFKTSDNPQVLKNSRTKFEKIIKNLDFEAISSLEKEVEGTSLYSFVVYHAFLKSHKEGKVEERNVYYYRLKQIGGKYEREAEKIVKKEEKKKKQYIAKIMILIPLSGEFAEYGKEFMNGFNLGALSPGIFEIFDTKSDPLYTYNALQNILQKPPYLFVGPLSTRCALAVFPLFSQEKVNVISPTATDIRLGIFGDNVFAFNEGIYYEIKKIAEFGLDNGYKKIGILYPRTYEGEVSKDVFIQLFNGGMNANLFSVSYSPDSTDYQAQILKIKSYFSTTENDSLPDAIVFFPSGEKDAIEMITQLKFLKITCPVLSNHFFLREKVGAVAGEYLKNVYIMGNQPFPLSSVLMDSFKEKYLKTFKKLPSDIAIRGYETALLLKEIITYGFKSSEGIKEYLETKGILKGINDFYFWKENLVKVFAYENKGFKEVSK